LGGVPPGWRRLKAKASRAQTRQRYPRQPMQPGCQNGSRKHRGMRHTVQHVPLQVCRMWPKAISSSSEQSAACKPHSIRTFKLSHDPRFKATVRILYDAVVPRRSMRLSSVLTGRVLYKPWIEHRQIYPGKERGVARWRMIIRRGVLMPVKIWKDSLRHITEHHNEEPNNSCGQTPGKRAWKKQAPPAKAVSSSLLIGTVR
jgi:hypothetical protein